MFSIDNSTPFSSDNDQTTISKIQNCEYKLPNGPHCTPEVHDLISRLLVKDPNLRLGADRI